MLCVGSHKHKGQIDASFQPTAKAITPTLSEVQHAYAAEFPLKGALRRQGHEAVTVEKGGRQTPSANKAAPEHVDLPLRQISSYGDVLSPQCCGFYAQEHHGDITRRVTWCSCIPGKFLAWSLEHTPSWELHATKQDILSPTKEYAAQEPSISFLTLKLAAITSTVSGTPETLD